MKILIAVDGSDDGFAAVRQVGQLLSCEHDQVAFFYSPPVVHVDSSSSVPMAGIIDRVRQVLADSVFDEARVQLPDGFHASLHCIIGHHHPRKSILAASDDWRAELVVMGARGLGPIQKTLLGSVSRTVAHSATVPVMVARANKERTAAEGYRVLVAFDESKTNAHAIEVMTQLTFPGHTIGRAVKVIESMFAGEVPNWLEQQARDTDSEAMAQAWVREHDQERQHTYDVLAALITRLPEAFHGHEPIVREGHPGEQILKTIADQAIDLVVVGMRDHGMIDSTFTDWRSNTQANRSLSPKRCRGFIVMLAISGCEPPNRSR
jgi:nucleotide-binding universal stress UspA family protein